jgi:RNA methyltransferase, trmH family, group 3
MKFAGKRALVMGSEGEGIPQKALAKCDECVGIKLKDGWDSLNVSAAFAIICDRMIDE